MNFSKIFILITVTIVVTIGVVSFFRIGDSELQKKSQVESVDLGGIKVSEVKIGEGAVAKTGDSISVHYVGTLQDGVEFDNSRVRKKPLEFILGEGKAIRGEEGIIGMKVGGIRTLTVPPEQGYGPRSHGKVPPNSILIYEIELLKILGKK